MGAKVSVLAWIAILGVVALLIGFVVAVGRRRE